MLAVVVQQKSTTANATGLRLYQGQHHLHRNGGVHRCAACLQHLVTRIAGQRVGGRHAALFEVPTRFGLVAAGGLGQIGDAVIQLGLRKTCEQAKRQSEYFCSHLFWRQADRTIKADDLTIEHVVVQNVHHQFGVIHGRTQARGKGHTSSQSFLHLFGHGEHHGGAKNARGDGHVANAQLGQVAGDGQSHAHDATFGS